MSLWDRPNGPTSGAASVGNQIPMNQQAGVPGPLPVTQTIGVTAETQINSAINPAVALTCALEPDTAIEQTLFNVIASGYIKTTNSTSITISLYEGASVATGTLLKASSATAQNSATASWFVRADLIFDSVSGVLAGTVGFYINKTLVASATLANFPTGFTNNSNPSANPPVTPNLPLFCLSVTSSAADGTHLTTVNVEKFSCG